MNLVSVTQNGRLLCDGHGIDGEPLAHLGHFVELLPGFTLRSFFLLFDQYPILTKFNTFFPTIREKFNKAPASGCIHTGFNNLVLTKTIEMIGFPGEPRIEIYQSLAGACGAETLKLELMRFESLLDMPLMLGKLKHIVFGDKVDVFEFDTVFTLFEFIDGILWEMSFQGMQTECELRR